MPDERPWWKSLYGVPEWYEGLRDPHEALPWFWWASAAAVWTGYLLAATLRVGGGDAITTAPWGLVVFALPLYVREWQRFRQSRR